jgi:hypothetical protein
MLEFFGKIFRSIIFIAMAGLMGFYDFGVSGYIGLATNLFFAAIGGLLVQTWQSPTKKESAKILEMQSLPEQSIDANVAGLAGGTATVETITQVSTPKETS